MANLENIIQSNALASLAGGASRGVANAIKQASARTGVNFAYLVRQAAAESSFNAGAKAKTSSATGLYQFIESTWLNMVEKYGGKHGISTENKSRSEILEMRKDPKAAALMAAEFASENEKFLKTHTDGEIGSTELYFAHFLGAGKAAAFLNARADNPLQDAATLFPRAAKANRNVFYDTATGRAKTMAEVYAHFDNKFDGNTAPLQTAGHTKRENTTTRSDITPPRPTGLNYVKLNPFFPSLEGGGRGRVASHDLALEILDRNRPASSDYSRVPFRRMLANPIELMLLTQLELPLENSKNERLYSHLK